MARKRLPLIPFRLSAGEITKIDPTETSFVGLSKSQNADAYREVGAWGQAPGTTRRCYPVAEGWKSLHYFEHFDLAGSLKRDVIGLAGDKVYQVRDDLSTTLVDTGRAPEPLSWVTTLDRIHLCSRKNTPFKFDGGTVTRWGVEAPGTREFLLEPFDDESNFSVTGGSKADGDGLVSADGSVAVDKDQVATATATLTRSSVNLDFRAHDGDVAFVRLFLPAGSLPQIDSASVSLSDGANANVWTFAVGDLRDGINLLSLPLGAPDEDNGANLTAVTEMEFSVTTAAVAQTLFGIRWDELVTTARPAPRATVDPAGTAVDGTVTYRVTFVSEYGQESNAGAPSAAAAANGANVTVDLIPLSDDPQVIARRLYRDRDGDADWRFLTQIDDNTTTFYEDNVSFAALGSITPPLASDELKDYSPPPRMIQVVSHNGTLVGIDAAAPFRLNIGLFGFPEAWPTIRVREFDFEITGLIPHALGTLICGSDRVVLLRGDAFSNFRFDEIHPRESTGLSGWRAWAPFKRIAYTWWDNGAYGQDGTDPWYLSDEIRDQVDALDSRTFREIHVAHDRHRHRFLTFIQSEEDGDYDTIKVYAYGIGGEQISPVGGGIDPLDIRQGAWARIVLPEGLNPTCSAVVERRADRPEVWIGCDDGVIYHLGDPEARDWDVGLGTEAIETEIVTNWAHLEEPVTCMARFLHVEGTATVRSTWTATIESADQARADTPIATATIPFDLGPGSTARQIPVPAGLHGEYFRITLANSAKGEDGTFRELELEVIPRRIRRAA